ncbi:MAG: hypothetical protein E6G97_18725 [Alphaproteobacteria bacterium]|nr:MAG: hypothetical protein E6G97_18725 [Alphaproteobacteria bacterium]
MFPRSSKLPPDERKTRLAEIEIAKKRPLDMEQKALLLGTLLGDGYISPEGYFAINHSPKQAEYLWTKYICLSELVVGVPSLSKKNKLGHRSVRFWTVVTSELKYWRELCYPGGVKTVTEAWLKAIDETNLLQALAWWVADDGSHTKLGCTPGLRIFTNGFTCSTYAAKVKEKTYPQVMFKTSSAVRLMRILEDFTPPSMYYKLDTSGRVETADCHFCGKNFPSKGHQAVWKKKIRYWCCGSDSCLIARRRLWYANEKAHPLAKERQEAARAKKKARPVDREAVRAKQAAWNKKNPEKLKAYQATYRAKKTGLPRATEWSCQDCKPKRAVMLVRLSYLRMMLKRDNLSEEKRATFSDEFTRLTASLWPTSSGSKT